MYKLCLTDGKRRVVGASYTQLPFLGVASRPGGAHADASPDGGLRAGAKVVVTHAHIRGGLLLLTPSSCALLGGSCGRLERAAEEVRKSLGAPVGSAQLAAAKAARAAGQAAAPPPRGAGAAAAAAAQQGGARRAAEAAAWAWERGGGGGGQNAPPPPQQQQQQHPPPQPPQPLHPPPQPYHQPPQHHQPQPPPPRPLPRAADDAGDDAAADDDAPLAGRLASYKRARRAADGGDGAEEADGEAATQTQAQPSPSQPSPPQPARRAQPPPPQQPQQLHPQPQQPPPARRAVSPGRACPPPAAVPHLPPPPHHQPQPHNQYQQQQQQPPPQQQQPQWQQRPRPDTSGGPFTYLSSFLSGPALTGPFPCSATLRGFVASLAGNNVADHAADSFRIEVFVEDGSARARVALPHSLVAAALDAASPADITMRMHSPATQEAAKRAVQRFQTAMGASRVGPIVISRAFRGAELVAERLPPGATGLEEAGSGGAGSGGAETTAWGSLASRTSELTARLRRNAPHD